MKARVEAYRRDVLRGANPFEGAFPLWRNEQFVAATTRLKSRGDPSALASFAEMEQAVLLEAQRRELRFLNQRDAAERGEDAEEERDTCTAAPPTAPTAISAGARADRSLESDLHALAAGLGEDDGEELEVEGDAAIEEGLRGNDDDEDKKGTRFPSALSDPAATRDPFLVAAAEAVAGGDTLMARKSLQLGRRWYDGNRREHPNPAGHPDRREEKREEKSGGAEARGATSGDSGGSGAGGSVRSGPGSGEETLGEGGQAPPAAFTRPPKLILYPDGSMGEAPVPGAAAATAGVPPLAPTASGPEALEKNAAAAPQTGFYPAPFGNANQPFAYPSPWGHTAQVPGGHAPPTFAANAMAFAPNGTGFPAGFPLGGFPLGGFPPAGFPLGGFPPAGFPLGGFPPGDFPPGGFPPGFPPHPAALFGFPPAFAPGAPFPPAAPFPAPAHPANAAAGFEARAAPSGSDGPGGAGSAGSGGSGGSGGTKVSSGPGYRSGRAAGGALGDAEPRAARTRETAGNATKFSRGVKRGSATKKRGSGSNAGDAVDAGAKKARVAEKTLDDAADCLQMLGGGGGTDR